MSAKPKKTELGGHDMKSQETYSRYIEVVLTLVTLALCSLYFKATVGRAIVLNLFFLPIVLGAFSLGRYRAGVLSLLAVVVTSAMTIHAGLSMGTTSPLIVAMNMSVWGAVLGLSAILVGTLSDERSSRIQELRDAHLGVVEAVSSYLDCARSGSNSPVQKVAHLSKQVALQMKLPPTDVDNVHVAALLKDLNNVEVTSRVIRRAINSTGSPKSEVKTFDGREFVESLGCAISGALNLLSHAEGDLPLNQQSVSTPLGTRIIQVVQRYYTKLEATRGTPDDRRDVLTSLKSANTNTAIVEALTRVVLPGATPSKRSVLVGS